MFNVSTRVTSNIKMFPCSREETSCWPAPWHDQSSLKEFLLLLSVGLQMKMTRLIDILPDFPVTRNIPPSFEGNLCQIGIEHQCVPAIRLYKERTDGPEKCLWPGLPSPQARKTKADPKHRLDFRFHAAGCSSEPGSGIIPVGLKLGEEKQTVKVEACRQMWKLLGRTLQQALEALADSFLSSSEMESERQEVKTGGNISTAVTTMPMLTHWAELLIVSFISNLFYSAVIILMEVFSHFLCTDRDLFC